MDSTWDAILSLDPVAYWPLHDPGSWTDVSGHGNHLTQAGGSIGSQPSIVEGSARTCAEFALSADGSTGTSGWLQSSVSSLRFESMASGFTILQTFQPYLTTSYATIMSRMSDNKGFHAFIGTETSKLLTTQVAGNSVVNVQPVFSGLDGWGTARSIPFAIGGRFTYSLCFVYSPSGSSTSPVATTYNGDVQYLPQAITAWQGWGNTDTSSTELRLGADNSSTNRYAGKMQDVAVYDYPLTATQVSKLSSDDFPTIVVGLSVKSRSFVY
jgi:hypothetical protein